jgi:hypothetical protein
MHDAAIIIVTSQNIGNNFAEGPREEPFFCFEIALWTSSFEEDTPLW